jgi:hypothetical protein
MWQCSTEIASLTLKPWGDDRSTMRRHLPGWWGFGMRPIGLTWQGAVPTACLLLPPPLYAGREAMY